jgi:hypothetical protein
MADYCQNMKKPAYMNKAVVQICALYWLFLLHLYHDYDFSGSDDDFLGSYDEYIILWLLILVCNNPVFFQ